MVEMEPKLSSGEPIDVESPLTRSELTHIRCGYLSLRCWWSQLASKPPSFKHSPRCMYPEKCSYAWRLKFEGLAETEKIPFPKVDGIRRLQEVQKCLTVDPFLTKFMPETCRHNALQELQKCRENLLRQLHHHFDL
ncbi:hypothetical protein BDP27DRAFT_1332365 [Rhodocollybia butyracea]|uniref:Uncharacterized protein n=1 Tax=Rhodocollybia butyracea TaxID=206335 RepID=A0A9P5PGX6_9AGAR|nr:hypothetical protein BDP27DRAFT_1332365 [Rhodocollybia butyracea]